MADLERIKAIESDKVNRWCKDNGIESNTDLAFFFLNYQEALDAAGRAVADAWSMARHAAAPGLAVGVRGAVRVEQARPSTSSLPSREMPPAIRAQLRPSATLPRSVVKGGSLPASAYIQPGSERAPAEGESQLLAIMLAATPHRPSSVGEQSALHSFVVEVARRCEPVTLKNAIRTWQELRSFAASIRIDVADLSALQLATFIQTHEASTRAHNSLHWLVKNLKLRYDMSLVLKPGKKAAPSRFGTGAKQAPVFPPIAIYELENVLDRMAGHAKWTVLLAARFMIFGVVRYAHIQRSVLRSVTDVHFVCWCHRGKQASSRQGFFWSAPRLTVTGVDLWPLLRDQLQHVASVNGVAIEKLRGFCFDGEEAKPLAMSGFLQMLRYFLSHMLEKPSDLSSYSMRRVGPTWATMAALSEPDKLALGNWIDKGVAVGQTAARYSASKLRTATLLKLCLLGAAQNFSEKVAWTAISHAEVQQQLLVDRDSMDTLMSQSMEEIISTVTPSPDDVALALRPSFIKAARKRVDQLRARASRDVGAPLPVVDEPHEAVEPRDAGADEFYDFLARERWRRPGHSGRPEPFTAIHQGENLGNIWLGELPVQDDIPFLERQKITLIVSGMRETAQECGNFRHRKSFQMAVAVSYNGSDRQRSWEEVRMVVLSTLQSGESVLFHCRAGVHRGPMLAAVALAWVTRISFDDALYHIEQVRAIEPDKVRTRSGGDQIFDWARKEANRDLPSFSLPRHWAWRASSRSSCLWHVVSADGDSGPMCKWRQSDARNVFKGQTVSCNTTLEALGYDREICRVCAMLRPGSEWAFMHSQVRR